MRFSVETWAPEYGGGPDAAELAPAGGRVDPTVEREVAAWEPVTPSPAAAEPDTICFVDGVRRIDARVWITDGDFTRPGVCATVAAGVVTCSGGRATPTACRVEHVLVAQPEGAGPIATRHATYHLQPVPDSSTEALYLGIHARMTLLETQVSSGAEADVVVVDGPLRGRTAAGAVGFVKTHHVQYLPPELEPVIGRLGAGQRTPLLLLQQGPATRWSWYLRLPGPVAHAWSGVVRCELPATGTAEAAVDRADLVSGLLPTYASEPHKDPRAPQNLYPIAGLERELRRRLGDAQLLERSLRLAAVIAA